jgi:hypothetical protein
MTALGLGLGGALLMAAPAQADPGYPVTPGWQWDYVQESALGVGDAGSWYPNYLGTGIDLHGFTNDAFDGFLQDMEFTYNAVTLDPTFTNISTSFVDNGLSTVVAEATLDFGGGVVVDATRALEIQGSYALWSLTLDDGGAGILGDIEVATFGYLGSDEWSSYQAVGATALVSTDHDGTEGSDPIIGYDFSGLTAPVIAVTNGDDNVSVTFTGAAVQDFAVAVVDYDPCSFSTALATMVSAAPTLRSTFGTTIAPVYFEDCVIIEPLHSSAATPIDKKLWVADTSGLMPWGYFSNPSIVQVVGVDLPSTLAVTLEWDTVNTKPYLRLVGTAPAGTYSVLFYLEYPGDEPYRGYPLVADFTVDPGPELAATGIDTASTVTPGLVGAAVLSLIGVTLIVARKRRFN